MGGMITGMYGAAVKPGQDMAEASAQQQMAEYQAQAYTASAADARARGGQTAAALQAKGAATIGAAKTAFGSSGVDTQSGSALEAMRDTRMFSELDAQTAKNNAAREAWGYDVKATSASAQGMVDLAKGQVKANDDLMSGLGQTWNGMAMFAGGG